MKNTLLSDAIVLGSSLVKLTPSTWLAGDCGCFIGMAAKAIGVTCRQMMDEHPWLAGLFPIPAMMLGWFQRHGPHSLGDPFGVTVAPPPGSLYAWQIISVMAFMVSDGDLRFDAAIAWIREHEPVMQETSETPVEAQVAQ